MFFVDRHQNSVKFLINPSSKVRKWGQNGPLTHHKHDKNRTWRMSRQGFSTSLQSGQKHLFLDHTYKGVSYNQTGNLDTGQKTLFLTCSKTTHPRPRSETWSKSEPRLLTTFFQTFWRVFVIENTPYRRNRPPRHYLDLSKGVLRWRLWPHVKITRSKFQKISICEYQMAISKDPRRGGCVENVWPPNVQIFSLINVSQVSILETFLRGPHTKSGMRP